MTKAEEDKLLDELRDIWRDLAEALGWDHNEGVQYNKSNGVNEKDYKIVMNDLKDFVDKYEGRKI